MSSVKDWRNWQNRVQVLNTEEKEVQLGKALVSVEEELKILKI